MYDVITIKTYIHTCKRKNNIYKLCFFICYSYKSHDMSPKSHDMTPFTSAFLLFLFVTFFLLLFSFSFNFYFTFINFYLLSNRRQV